MTQRVPGWYGTAKPAPHLQGWLEHTSWYRAHYFAGESLPLCRKASRSDEGLTTAPADRRRCGHCVRSMTAVAATKHQLRRAAKAAAV